MQVVKKHHAISIPVDSINVQHSWNIGHCGQSSSQLTPIQLIAFRINSGLTVKLLQLSSLLRENVHEILFTSCFTAFWFSFFSIVNQFYIANLHNSLIFSALLFYILTYCDASIYYSLVLHPDWLIVSF